MKTCKYIASGIVMVVVVTGCTVCRDLRATFIYQNNTQWELALTTYHTDKIDSTFVIPIAGTINWNNGYNGRTPFFMSGIGGYKMCDSVVISNGVNQIVYRNIYNYNIGTRPDPIFDYENYIVLSSNERKSVYTYLWAFRDEDFIGAEPIVP
ncbi:MAG: hypothetical protein LBH06_09845 [Rikenellaceae bacterium]|jgi:PKD repeat protein|nr:hypothetical protein [Rikenellaceae bacterium]